MHGCCLAYLFSYFYKVNIYLEVGHPIMRLCCRMNVNNYFRPTFGPIFNVFTYYLHCVLCSLFESDVHFRVNKVLGVGKFY